MKKTFPSFDLGIDHLFPSEPEERKQKKEEQQRFACSLRSTRIKGWRWGRRKRIRAKKTTEEFFSLPPPLLPPLNTPATQATLHASIDVSKLDDLVKGAQAKTTKYATKYAVNVFQGNFCIQLLQNSQNHILCFFRKMYNKIKRKLYATDCECFLKSNFTRPCFGCQMFNRPPLHLRG